jgi:hypothetical protein
VGIQEKSAMHLVVSAGQLALIGSGLGLRLAIGIYFPFYFITNYLTSLNLHA